jgi:AcrR family transcriptional regulator
MARPRFDNLPLERRRAILSVAEAEFAAHGYTGASLNRIIKDAGLSKGVFYYYFDDKADLATTVFNEAARASLAAIDSLSLPEGVDFWDYFEAVLRGTMDALREAPRQTDALSRLGMAIISDARLSASLQHAMADWMKVIARFWKQGQEVGAVRDDMPAEVLVGLLQGVKESLARALLPKDRAPTVKELDHFTDLQIDFFRRVASPADASTRRRAQGKEEHP